MSGTVNVLSSLRVGRSLLERDVEGPVQRYRGGSHSAHGGVNTGAGCGWYSRNCRGRRRPCTGQVCPGHTSPNAAVHGEIHPCARQGVRQGKVQAGCKQASCKACWLHGRTGAPAAAHPRGGTSTWWHIHLVAHPLGGTNALTMAHVLACDARRSSLPWPDIAKCDWRRVSWEREVAGKCDSAQEGRVGGDGHTLRAHLGVQVAPKRRGCARQRAGMHTEAHTGPWDSWQHGVRVAYTLRLVQGLGTAGSTV